MGLSNLPRSFRTWSLLRCRDSPTACIVYRLLQYKTISTSFPLLSLVFSRKEVFQPHLPVRLPCYEFHRCRRTPQVEYLTLSLYRLLYIANGEYSSFTAWTTRVSNPVRYPRFRASASVIVWYAAFAIGVLRDIYAFHRYTTHSAYFRYTQGNQFQWQFAS